MEPYCGPYIDFHTHLFPEKLNSAVRNWFDANTSWRFRFRGEWREVADFLEADARLLKYVCFGYAHKKGISRELNRFYAEIPKYSPKAVPLMTAHQEDENLTEIAKEAFDLGLAGVKIHCQVQKASPSDPRFFPLYEKVIERKGLVLFHAGNGPFDGPCVGFRHFAELPERYPELKIVVAHLGCNEPELFLAETSRRENLWLDTSYTFIANPTNRMDAPLELLEKAHRKLLFATDFPGICHGYDEGVAAIADLPLSAVARERIFHANARELLESCGVTFIP